MWRLYFPSHPTIHNNWLVNDTLVTMLCASSSKNITLLSLLLLYVPMFFITSSSYRLEELFLIDMFLMVYGNPQFPYS